MQKIRFSFFTTLLLGGGLLASSCSKKVAEPSLYDRLGQTDGITKIVDNLIANIGAETATANTLMLRTHKPMLDAVNGINGAAPTDPTRLLRLRNHVIDQLGEATGGPVTYTGLSMLVAHKGMNITVNEFSVWRNQLEASLTTNKLSAQDKAALLAIIDKMQGDVVGH